MLVHGFHRTAVSSTSCASNLPAPTRRQFRFTRFGWSDKSAIRMTRKSVTLAMRKLLRRPPLRKRAKEHPLHVHDLKPIVHREKSKWIGMVSSAGRDN